jgi:sn-glycerol 3-phosphate transport system permease protein
MRADPYAPTGRWLALESIGAALLAILWILPLVYAVWAAFHPSEYTTRFELLAPLTLDNFRRAWAAAPFARYFLNTFVLVTLVLSFQLVLGTSQPTPLRVTSFGAATSPLHSCWRSS